MQTFKQLNRFFSDFKKLIYLKKWIQIDMQIKCINCKRKQTCLQCEFFIHFLDIFNQTEYRNKIILLARNLFLSYLYEFRKLHKVRTAYEQYENWQFE